MFSKKASPNQFALLTFMLVVVFITLVNIIPKFTNFTKESQQNFIKGVPEMESYLDELCGKDDDICRDALKYRFLTHLDSARGVKLRGFSFTSEQSKLNKEFVKKLKEKLGDEQFRKLYKNILGEFQTKKNMKPKRIILHHTATRDVQHTINVLKDRDGGVLGVQFIIGKNGEIVQGANIDYTANHACGANHDAIGFEIVNLGGGSDPYTEAQYKSIKIAIEILDELIQNKADPFVIAHYEVSKYYPKNFFGRNCDKGKWDPSPDFNWAKVGVTKSTKDLKELCEIVKNDKNTNFKKQCFLG